MSCAESFSKLLGSAFQARPWLHCLTALMIEPAKNCLPLHLHPCHLFLSTSIAPSALHVLTARTISQVFVVAFIGMGLGSWAAIWEFIQNTSDFGVFAECALRHPALVAALQCLGKSQPASLALCRCYEC